MECDGNAGSWGDDEWNARHEIVERAQLNHLYHQRRERTLAMADRIGKSAALIAGTAAASALLHEGGKAVAGFLVACVTLPSLVFSWADKARLHAELAAEYVRIESEIEAAGVLDWAAIDRFKSRLIAIGAKEPPALSLLLIACHNEIYIARDQRQKVVPISGWKRLWMHVFSMPMSGEAPTREEGHETR